ncbi:ABC transporter ATP-binding protein [Propionispira raffinosivorans]|uniref:ABC transporter ATP-binding protein n=1 Tax=Propionispira raffinosivorans TaxID=86959 RepID=UPI000374DB76|nr:ABC transporter ATP-binding protein [Propionispira raffinosivorans]
MDIMQTRDLTIKIQNKDILTKINLSFLTGKTTAIIGPNGSGKSTLLKALAGLNNNITGQVLFENKDIKDFSKKNLARNLAILPQDPSVPADLTVGELVQYGRFPYQRWFARNDKEDQQCVKWAMQQTQIEDFKNRFVTTLSGGERQRTWIAMALAQKPKVLLLDEPTTYLDIAHQLEVMQIIDRLTQKYNITIIMVLHDMNQALQYANDLVVIKNQSVFAQGSPQKIVSANLLEKVFGVTADFFTNRDGNKVLVPISLVKAD